MEEKGRGEYCSEELPRHRQMILLYNIYRFHRPSPSHIPETAAPYFIFPHAHLRLFEEQTHRPPPPSHQELSLHLINHQKANEETQSTATTILTKPIKPDLHPSRPVHRFSVDLPLSTPSPSSSSSRESPWENRESVIFRFSFIVTDWLSGKDQSVII